MKTKNYSGYRSYQYLEAGVDFPGVKLATQIDRVASHRPEVSADQEARAQRLLTTNTVISLHDHCGVAPANIEQMHDYRAHGREATGFEGLAISGLDCIFDGLSPRNYITSQSGWKWSDTIHDLGQRLCDIAHQDMVVRYDKPADIAHARENGQIAFLPALEAVTCIENEVDRLDILYGLGVRCGGIAYQMSNTLGGGGGEAADGGLTVFGKRAVRRMNQLGMAIDIAHAGDRTSMETIKASTKPIFITHVGARALWDTKRMKPDELVRACAERGGVIGIEAAPQTTLTKNHRRHTIESYMEHFEYIAQLVGIDHVAFGPDTYFGDHVGLGRIHGFTPPPPGTDAIEYVDGVENPAEAFPNIVRWLVTHGHSDADIAKALGLNILRVLGEIGTR